jgi:ABC-type uncharacterized transport system auxiliary subunit
MKRVLAIALLAGCALTRKSAPLQIRQFTPEVPYEAGAPTTTCGALALGRITASGHLRYRIAHRSSPVEISLYETLRWTDHPDSYVRRALERELFHQAALSQALYGSGLTLDVDVLGFEELETPRAAGRVQLAFRLRDDRSVITSGVLTTTRPSASPKIEDVVTAIGEATAAAARDVTARVAPIVRARAHCTAPAT